MQSNIIEEIYRTGVVRDEQGNEYPLLANVDRLEGEFIHNLIRNTPNLCKVVEIGCAYGLSSLYIGLALAGRPSVRHIIVDPLEYRLFHGVGIANLKRAGLTQFELVEQPSEVYLPKLAQQEAGAFDLVFIDGWHTFDHTMLDLFYANRLLGPGGYIVIDDCNWSSVAKAVSYVAQYPAYQLASQCPTRASLKRVLANIVRAILPPAVAGYVLPRNLYDRYYIRTIYSSMVALRKVRDDERNWDWFVSF